MANEAMRERWNGEVGRSWVEQQERMDRSLIPFAQAVLGAGSPFPGDRVLDVGCGCGATTLSFSHLVGETGWVTGVDLSAPMLARAAERAGLLGFTNVEFVEADAQTWQPSATGPGGAAGYDLVASRFGVMFFDQPVEAFANLLRCTRTGGRLAAVVWRSLAENPWNAVPLAVVQAVRPDGPPPPDPRQPGPFAFGSDLRVHAVLDAAGWADVRVEPFDAPMRLGATLAEAVDRSVSGSNVAAVLAGADDATLQAARAAVGDALAPYASDAGVSLPGAAWVVTARAGAA